MGRSFLQALESYRFFLISSSFGILFSACTSGQVDTTAGDSEDTVEEAGPCGLGTPTDCVEVVDGICWAPDFDLPTPSLTDDVVDRIARSDHAHFGACGVDVTLRCGALLAQPYAPPDGFAVGSDGGPVLEGQTGYGVWVYDYATRAPVGRGRVHTDRIGTPCYRMYYGERAGLECFRAAVEYVNANYEVCDFSGPCDACVCRANEVTDVRHPECTPPAP